MSWIVAALSVVGTFGRAHSPKADRSLEIQTALAELSRSNYEVMRAGMLTQVNAPPRKARPAKCPCCGSREYVEHQGQTICRYCRGVA